MFPWADSCVPWSPVIPPHLYFFFTWGIQQTEKLEKEISVDFFFMHPYLVSYPIFWIFELLFMVSYGVSLCFLTVFLLLGKFSGNSWLRRYLPIFLLFWSQVLICDMKSNSGKRRAINRHGKTPKQFSSLVFRTLEAWAVLVGLCLVSFEYATGAWAWLNGFRGLLISQTCDCRVLNQLLVSDS